MAKYIVTAIYMVKSRQIFKKMSGKSKGAVPKVNFNAFDKQRGRAGYLPSGRQQLSQQHTHAYAFVGWLA